MSSPPVLPPALQAAGFIGTWSADVPAGRSILDEGAAALLAGDADLAGQPLPLEVALARTHPEDHDWMFARIRRARSTGGPFSAEFRVLTDAGDVRWVLDCGSLAPDRTGVMHGLGVFIDTTDSHRGPFLPVAPAAVEADPLLTASELCLEARAAIVRTGDRGLRRACDLMLWEIGRALARRVGV